MKKLSVENKIQSLNNIAEFIERFGEENNLSLKTTFELNLILDELITNTIHYGYSDSDVHFIDIFIEIENNNVNLKIIDDANEFNPIEKEEVDLEISLEEKKIGGLGIHFIKQKADNISYERKENKNILQITKKL